jgi:hypothetical protein
VLDAITLSTPDDRTISEVPAFRCGERGWLRSRGGPMMLRCRCQQQLAEGYKLLPYGAGELWQDRHTGSSTHEALSCSLCSL